ncbi:MAG: hypothetical protein A3F68_10445 [Acidobacteria bacterium RIFCSPLOWO2_12_FULL_54_10]|nr:MAG: hypothetical protein A3F68_10445 [Acidobacteria bacterium RIFCSPLOWO2_12_FULL_54_10]
MASKSPAIQVEIYDRPYTLRTDAGQDYTRNLAQAVDTVMRSIGEKTNTIDSLRLAVLAALHFADECERMRKQYHDLESAVTEKTAAFHQALDHIASENE